MTKKEDKKGAIASIIEVESKEGGFIKILVQSKDNDNVLELFRKVRKEIKKNE